MNIATQLILFFEKLTSTQREKVLIADDSLLKRPRTKMLELLSWVHDHQDNKHHKGYRFLSLCWSDGNSFLPLDFSLLASAKEKSRLQGVTKEMDKPSCGYKRRIEAMCKAPDILQDLVKRVLGKGIKAQYLLMDSGFALPSTIAALREHIHIVGMVKRNPEIHYKFQGKSLSLDSIYRLLKKRPGSAKTLTSAVVDM